MNYTSIYIAYMRYIVGGAISIRDPYICDVHESVPTNSTQVRCLCSENLGIDLFRGEKNSAI